MVSLEAHERRIVALEARVRDIEGSHGESIYQLRRESIETKLGIRTILDHLGLPKVIAEQVDEELDQA